MISMKRMLQRSFCILTLIASVHAQQVGHADVSNPVEPSEDKAETTREGCDKLHMILTHGSIPPDENQPKKLTLEVTRLITEQAVIGKEVVADVQLRNSGKYAVRIPWSTNLALPEQAPDPDNGEFEVGEFDVHLLDAAGGTALKVTSRPLLGAPSSTGSLLEIAPGQWVTVTIRFKLEDEYGTGSGLKPGEAQIGVTWRQWIRTWSVNRKNCQAVRGSINYNDDFYHQQSKPLKFTLTKEPIPDSKTPIAVNQDHQ